MRYLASLLLIATAAMAQPALATPTPTATDESAIDKLIGPSITALKSGKTRQAVDAFLGSNPLISSKTSDVAYLTSQIDSTVALYGPIGECELTQVRSFGSMVEQRLYICQHKNFATRWIYLTIKSTSGWIAANLLFDDKITIALGE